LVKNQKILYQEQHRSRINLHTLHKRSVIPEYYYRGHCIKEQKCQNYTLEGATGCFLSAFYGNSTTNLIISEHQTSTTGFNQSRYKTNFKFHDYDSKYTKQKEK